MKTHTSHRFLQCGIAAVALVACASAFAGPNTKATAKSSHAGRKTTRAICYVQLSNTSFPQPCTRLNSGLPNTASPMVIIGELPMKVVRQ